MTVSTDRDLEDGLREADENAQAAAAAEPVPAALPALPRVNLLPPEIGERARLRRLQTGLGAGLVVVAGAVAVLHLGAAGSVTEAEQELQAANEAAAALRAESGEFSGVLGVHAEAEQAREVLRTAMGQEVRFSGLLDDLSRSVPDGVWLKTVQFSQAAPTPAADGEQPAAGDGIGTVTFTGVALRHDDVAAWLESLASQEGYADARFADSTASTIGGRAVVTFTSSVSLTPAALSQRFAAPEGS